MELIYHNYLLSNSAHSFQLFKFPHPMVHLGMCCPTSAKFDNFLTQFQNSYFRAAGYVVFAIIMWLAFGIGGRTLQIVSALLLTGGAVSYTIAALRHQTPASSTITGGTGVSTIV
ncbi:hypothetical protein BX616_002429 [Lobosporangium transversale]|nr:hypothetical protein BX616_002429 [Lobosporangium transversale]